MRVNVYVPAKLRPSDPTPHFFGGNKPSPVDFLPGSAIVSEGDSVVGRIMVDYEGNKYDAMNMRRYIERVMNAADRHVRRYPTIARAFVLDYQLTLVGEYDVDTKQLFIDPWDMGRFKEWLGIEGDVPESEIVL